MLICGRPLEQPIEGVHAQGLKTQAHLKPGQKGTKRHVVKYGQSLLCVRYRYDKVRGVRLKTVEIVVEEKAWPVPPQHGDRDTVGLHVAYTERFSGLN